MIRVGVTASHSADANGGPHPDVAPYLAAVRRAGAEPVALDAARAPASVLDGLDALVLSGGVDVDPARYGGRLDHARSQAGTYVRERDDFEIALVHAVRERAVPVLCICRGMQVANVAFGGALIEDVREEFERRGEPYPIHHRQTYEDGRDRSDYATDHAVSLEAGSLLARIVGGRTIATNSTHHQALRAPADGLRVVGRTADGVIEAVEATFAHPFFVGVQWHPEELDDAPNNALFAALVRAAEGVQPERVRA